MDPMIKPIVYVVQNQHKQDQQSGELVPKWDLSPAAEYGELQFLLSPTARPFKPMGIIEELHQKLKGYRPEHDFLLLLGNPCLIGMVVAIAALYGKGSVNLLQWDGRNVKYAPIRTTIYDEMDLISLKSLTLAPQG
jgi:hypothetical protein